MGPLAGPHGRHGVLVRATREAEGCDAGGPSALRTGYVVLIRVPEGSILDWVHAHAAVRTPIFVGAVLRARARDQSNFRLHCADLIGCGMAGVANSWVYGQARHGVSDGDVAILVLRDGRSPAVGGLVR